VDVSGFHDCTAWSYRYEACSAIPVKRGWLEWQSGFRAAGEYATDQATDTEEQIQMMAEQKMAQLRAVKTIMKLCFHQNDVDRTIDALITLGIGPDLITQAISSTEHGHPEAGAGSGGPSALAHPQPGRMIQP
jgi:hypothetical protein